jgi:coenzyme F420-0:L-glutamate ligase/coenzyme F420-1:gamma-L-glutamate ligase
VAGDEQRPGVHLLPVPGLPEVSVGDDVGALVHEAVGRAGLDLRDGDVVAVASKVLSKAAGLRSDGRREDAIAAETVRVVAERLSDGRLTQVVESASGPVMAAAGVDESNSGEDARPLLLPRDPDAVAAELRERLASLTGVAQLGVLVTDTAGRPWRAGQVDVALGCAGLRVTDDLRGGVDADGRPLVVTVRAVADEVAAAADLVKGKSSGVPVAVVRGLGAMVSSDDVGGARALLRTGPSDWFASGPVEALRSALGVHPGTDDAREVGIPSVTNEDESVRLRRAVALALHDLDDDADVAVDAGPGSVSVTGHDAYAVGWVAARLTVALAAEGLGHGPPDVERGADGVRATLAVTTP